MKPSSQISVSLAGMMLCWAPMAAAQPQASSTEAAASATSVDPNVVQALQRMGAYLGTLKTFSIRANTTIDQEIDNGQKVQLSGQVTYRVRRPDAFHIEVSSDRPVRQFYYDGKALTVFAPRLGYYATVAAPDTIAKTLDAAYAKYDIALPLQDLFTWSDANLGRADFLQSAVHIGYAQIDGVDTDHYAMRESALDWQIWIRRGERPLPMKVAIVSTGVESQPQYTTNLTWVENPKLTDAEFRFGKPKGSLPIQIVALED